jgi:hypothetical protein
MPHAPHPSLLPRLPIQPAGGLWRFGQSMRSPATRRQVFSRIMCDNSLSEAQRLPRLRTLIDLGVWGDHHTDQEIIDVNETSKSGVLAQLREFFEQVFADSSWILNDIGQYEKDRGALGLHLFVAANNKHCSPELVHLAFEAGVDPAWREGNNYNDTWLTYFARCGQVEQFTVALNAGTNPQHRDSCHQTALHLLLTAMQSETDWSASALEMANRLAEAGLNINSTGIARPFLHGPPYPGLVPLFDALANDNEPAIAWLISNGARVDVKDFRGNTAAHFAAFTWKPNVEKVMRPLVDAGTPLDEPNNLGQTPLWCAVSKGNTSKALWLIAHGASLAARPTGRLDEQQNIVPEPGPSLLHALVVNNNPDEDALQILGHIRANDPDCWRQLLPGTGGMRLIDLVGQLNRKHGDQWSAIATSDELIANTAPSPEVVKKSALRL